MPFPNQLFVPLGFIFMALTDNPYLPLYVRDWLTSNKLSLCSANAHGVLINIMCVMHRENDYGKILLKQKFKQNSSTSFNFASQLAKLIALDFVEIKNGIDELLDENVLVIEGDFLVCQRMVLDANKSINKSKNGKKGGLKTQSKNKNFASNFAKAKVQANTEIENEIENKNEIIKLSKNGFFKNELPDEIKVLSKTEIKNTIQFIKFTKQVDLTNEKVIENYNGFIIQQMEVKEWCRSRGDFIQHFRFWLKKQDLNNTNNGTSIGNNIKQSSSSTYLARMEKKFNEI